MITPWVRYHLYFWIKRAFLCFEIDGKQKDTYLFGSHLFFRKTIIQTYNWMQHVFSFSVIIVQIWYAAGNRVHNLLEKIFILSWTKWKWVCSNFAVRSHFITHSSMHYIWLAIEIILQSIKFTHVIYNVSCMPFKENLLKWLYMFVFINLLHMKNIIWVIHWIILIQ